VESDDEKKRRKKKPGLPGFLANKMAFDMGPNSGSIG
jgi:hypothetical protein